jgi:hypothetical protein
MLTPVNQQSEEFSQITVRNLMAGYAAYTDAQELAASRGTHQGALVTTTGTVLTSTSVLVAAHDYVESDNAVKASIITTLRQARENV